MSGLGSFHGLRHSIAARCPERWWPWSCRITLLASQLTLFVMRSRKKSRAVNALPDTEVAPPVGGVIAPAAELRRLGAKNSTRANTTQRICDTTGKIRTPWGRHVVRGVRRMNGLGAYAVFALVVTAEMLVTGFPNPFGNQPEFLVHSRVLCGYRCVRSMIRVRIPQRDH